MAEYAGHYSAAESASLHTFVNKTWAMFGDEIAARGGDGSVARGGSGSDMKRGESGTVAGE